MKHLFSSSGFNSLPAYAFISFMLIMIVQIACASKNLPFIPTGSSEYTIQAARVMFEPLSVRSSYMSSLFNMLVTRSAQEHETYWQDVFSITAQEELIPKHGIPFSFIASLFFYLLGEPGFYLLPLAMSFVITISLYYITKRFSLWQCPGLLLIAVLFGATQWELYLYGINLDVFHTMLIVSGFGLAFRFPLIGSFILGLSVFCRPINLILSPLLLWATLDRDKNAQQIRDLCTGYLFASILYACYNWYIFGSPLISAYHRFPSFQDGMVIYNHGSLILKVDILLNDWWIKLFDPHVGLITNNPILVLIPLLFFRTHGIYFKSATPIFLYFLANALLVFSYFGWEVNPVGGNRYMLPAILLLSTVIVASIGNRVYQNPTR